MTTRPNPSLPEQVKTAKAGDILEVGTDGYLRTFNTFYLMLITTLLGFMLGWLSLYVLYAFKVLP